MPLSPGDNLGPYEIVELIGKGGMGEVYRAHDSRLRRDVAIKTSNEKFNERFLREARVIASLNHPNICALYDIGPDYLVMELVEGTEPKGPMGLEEALRIASQIAAALETAHQKGTIHRDLKPANVKITPNGTVKVLDFGLAKVMREASPDGPTTTMGLTEAGTAMGTPAYMAPEQAQGKEVDKRADVWAFGVVLYELLTGRRPFRADSLQGTLAAVLTQEPDYAKVPRRVQRLLRACLKKELQERLSNVDDWRFLLDEDQTVPQKAARTQWVPWAFVVAGAALGAFGLWRFRSVPAQSGVVRFGVPIPGGIAADVMIALSPDGRNLAFSALEDGKFRLRVRKLDELEARLLTGGDGAKFPFWSPDSSQIGFFADGKLKTILATGGETTTIAPVDSTILGGTWVRDGVIVFSQTRELFKVNDKGGTPELLYKPDSGIAYDPEALPDGRHFLYVNNTSGVYVGSLDRTPPVRILPDVSTTVYSPDGYLLFARQGRLNAQRFDLKTLTLTGEAIPVTREPVENELMAPTVSVGQGGALAYEAQSPDQLLWKDRTGAPLKTVGPAQGWRTFRLSPDDTKVAFDFSGTQGAGSSFGVAVLDLGRNTREQLTSEGKGALVPVFSPDGKQVAFTSNRMGRFNPYITSAPNQEHLVRDMGLKGGYPVDWSHDGRNLLWYGDDDLWVVPVDGGQPYNITNSRFGEQTGAFSPDDHWIAYSSNESGRYEIYLTPFPAEGGRRITVSSQGGAGPHWRHNGEEIFYVDADGRLTAVPVTIRGSDVHFGAPESLFPVTSNGFGPAYQASRDGKRFLVRVPVAGSQAAITVLLNWKQTLPK